MSSERCAVETPTAMPVVALLATIEYSSDKCAARPVMRGRITASIATVVNSCEGRDRCYEHRPRGPRPAGGHLSI